MELFKNIQVKVTASILLLLTILASCSNDELAEIETSPVLRVTTMKQFIPQTRNISDVSESMPVLQFKDEASFVSTVNQLKSMSEKERNTYMKKIGFSSAELVLKNADEELDKIFDIEDEESFKCALVNYKMKYQNVLAFNNSDSYDVTPYLAFTDSTMNLVGNAKGFVVIGNKLVAPKVCTPDYSGAYTCFVEVKSRGTIPGPIQPGFRSFKGTTLTIKNGKYKSSMKLGRIVNGNSFAIEFSTKKKQFLWKKKVKASYSLNLEMISKKFHHNNFVTCPSGPTVCILNLPIEFVGNVFSANVTNFKSSRGNAIGSAVFKDVSVI